ncbi:unnamed protein product [Lactuca virosa]|uniref:Uncharacterized protein n=1 Tax=Lactuca virosa TaxID=75947 RepID=A0AAU9P9K3_9ASTR|nr:unnamed protein product [Lactuca virosa]
MDLLPVPKLFFFNSSVTFVTSYTNLPSQLNCKLQIMWPANTSLVYLLNNYGVSQPVQPIDFVTNPSETDIKE